ncbi:MAG TPA: YeeE/YedE family protein [Acetobacteraceae bacterium]|nr:YeeE/YedE family protein [Acetobacteraceae bacterium]
MPRLLVALVSGLLFGLGLTVSGMINPDKVLGFLDIAGNWDPSLAFVMAAAIPVSAAGFALGRRRTVPVCAPCFVEPGKTWVDARLVLGAVLFGIGWGLVGYCPGPALAALGFGSWRTVLFVAAMLAGMAAYRRLGAARPVAPPLDPAKG